MLCNRYGLAIAARGLGEFQGASEAPVSVVILVERATPKFAQRTAARRVESHTCYTTLVWVVEIQKNLATTLGVFDSFFDLGRFVCCGDWQS